MGLQPLGLGEGFRRGTERPERLGVPVGIKGLADVTSNPIHSTGVGLLLYGRDHLLPGSGPRPLAGSARSVLTRMRNWFQGNF